MFKILCNQVRTYARRDEGAVTVDWVVITAAVVGLGIAVVASVSGGTSTLGETIGTEVAGVEVYTGADQGDPDPEAPPVD
ncbi:hypothetical protein [Celeribacter arenosi]|uniref:Flp pilus assembly protein, pilin Flp n=1 Tax=Celeribacter arenosi TaxID=792649 RepID=A0ABP7K9D6_9RHOB